MRRNLSILFVLFSCLTLHAQIYNEMDEDGNIVQRDESGYDNQTFNPNRRDSVKKNKEIPRGVHVWTVDRRFGNITPAEVDTMPHLFQNSIYNEGRYGEYNTLGNNYTARQSRIFTDRPETGEFFFVQPYSYMTKEPDEFLFVNTLSPYTNITYNNCGDKQHGEDHIDAKFAVNANKRLGFGFDLDYYYARGYYQNQSTSHFNATLFSSYVGNRYQMHLLATIYTRKANENGGITNDYYITHPELYTDQFSEEEIPTVLSQNWNRNRSQHLFLSHRYNLGFYRKVKMTDEEIKARQFASRAATQKALREAGKGTEGKDMPLGRRGAAVQPSAPAGRPANAQIMGDEPGAAPPPAAEQADTTRIKVETGEAMDSLLAEQARQDSIDATMKREYVPVTSFIHTLDINNYEHIYQAYATPADYYANTFYDLDYDGWYGGDNVFDQYNYTSVKNTFAIALLEGFNKYMKAGLKGFVSYEHRRYKMPDLESGATAYHLATSTGHCLYIGGEMSKTQGKTLHFNLTGELGVTGMDAGNITVDFNTDLNFPLFGDTVQLAAKASFHRLSAGFFQDSYHSKHLWWDQSLDAETRTHLEGLFSYSKTNTQLRIAIDEIQNYTYFGMSYATTDNGRTGLTGGIYQTSANINVLTAQLRQNLRWGILNWENIVTYQNSSSPATLPLPALNLFTNLYLKFKIARVLSVEFGGCATYYSKYEAPDYLPQLSQFAVQMNDESRIETGGYPYVDVYANLHLKRARFFVAMHHLNAKSGTKDYFLTPHYPTNGRIMHLGVSWNFYN